jgi:hypothetical protein
MFNLRTKLLFPAKMPGEMFMNRQIGHFLNQPSRCPGRI